MTMHLHNVLKVLEPVMGKAIDDFFLYAHFYVLNT